MLEKDPSLRAGAARQLGEARVAAFLARVEDLQARAGDFVVEEQEEHIVHYHQVRAE